MVSPGAAWGHRQVDRRCIDREVADRTEGRVEGGWTVERKEEAWMEEEVMGEGIEVVDREGGDIGVWAGEMDGGGDGEGVKGREHRRMDRGGQRGWTGRGQR